MVLFFPFLVSSFLVSPSFSLLSSVAFFGHLARSSSLFLVRQEED
jgi:hypothetical protein